jgi:hypothetical protein
VLSNGRREEIAGSRHQGGDVIMELFLTQACAAFRRASMAAPLRPKHPADPLPIPLPH